MNIKIERRNFYIDLKHSSYDIKERLGNIILSKINHSLEIASFQDRDIFDSLGLNYAPVYIVNRKKIGNTHIRLYEKVLKGINQNLNFVVIDGVANVENVRVNCINVCLESLSYNEIALLNNFNVNSKNNFANIRKKSLSLENFNSDLSLSKRANSNYYTNYFYNFEDIPCVKGEFVGGKGEIALKDRSNLIFKLPTNPFGYIMIGKTNKVEIYDVFKEKILTVRGNFKASIVYNTIKFEITYGNILEFELEQKQTFSEIFELLDLEVVYDNFSFTFQELKKKALEDLNKNFFVINEKVEGFNVESLSDYFKCAKMRKKYFNDYVYLLTSVLGIKIVNSILTVSPKSYVNGEFAITYNYNGNRIEVKFSQTTSDMVKLSHVGHKMGVIDKFVYSY